MSHLRALGLKETATEAEIKTAFRKLAKIHHPDAGGDKVLFQKLSFSYTEALKLVKLRPPPPKATPRRTPPKGLIIYRMTTGKYNKVENTVYASITVPTWFAEEGGTVYTMIDCGEFQPLPEFHFKFPPTKENKPVQLFFNELAGKLKHSVILKVVIENTVQP